MTLRLLSRSDKIQLLSRGERGKDGVGYLGARERPGDVIELFTASLSDKAENLAPVSGALVVNANGAALRVPGQVDPVIIASRQDFAVEEGQVYLARWAVTRFHNTSDPFGDAVEFRVAWLDASKSFISTALATKRALVVSDGRFAHQATVSRDQPADITAPAGARYMRPYVRLLGGNGVTDIEVIDRGETSGLPGPKGDIGREPEYFLNSDAETVRWRQANGTIGPALDIGSARKKAEAARDIAQDFASDLVSQGNVPIYSTLDRIGELTIPAGINAFRTNGRSVRGDGGDILAIEDPGGRIVDETGRRFFAIPKRETRNQLWGGHFAMSQEASAFVPGAFRKQMLDGMTGMRLDGSAAITIYHDVGLYYPNSVRMQRNAGNASTSPFVAVWNMSAAEAKALRGERCFASFYAQKGANFSAPNGRANLSVICSRGMQQPITRADGMFSGGNQVLANFDFAPGLDMNRWLDPFWFTYDVPDDAEQVAFVLTVPYAGAAGVDDWLRIEALHVDLGAFHTQMPEVSREELMRLAKTRYRATYPYGTPPGTPTLLGAKLAVANVSAVANYSVVFDHRWDEPMVERPSVVCRSHVSGATPRIGDVVAGTGINAMLFDVSANGVIVTNNAAVVAGQRYASHIVARAML